MKPKLFFLILFLLLFVLVKAQRPVSADSLLKTARHAAFEEKDYNKARDFAHQALYLAPDYNDINIFLGRIFSWQKLYDSARYYFTKVLMTSPAHEDASVAFADLEYWNKNYHEALKISNTALAVHPDSEELLLRKARNLYALKNYKEASEVTSQILKSNKRNSGALALATALRDAAAVNKVSISYDHSSFDKQFDQPWHLASFSYGRQTQIGSITGRLNYANRFGKNGVQGEIDAYPRISKTFYSYLNFGYSDNVGVFPNYRAGFSLWAILPRSFEAEAGIRYLYFTRGTDFYTFYLGKYYKSFLFSTRTYLKPSGSSISQSYNLAVRYYFGGADDYFTLSAGTGISPDENNQNVQLNNEELLLSRQISASLNHSFLKWNVLFLRVGLINQEYKTNEKGNQLNLGVGLSHKF